MNSLLNSLVESKEREMQSIEKATLNIMTLGGIHKKYIAKSKVNCWQFISTKNYISQKGSGMVPKVC